MSLLLALLTSEPEVALTRAGVWRELRPYRWLALLVDRVRHPPRRVLSLSGDRGLLTPSGWVDPGFLILGLVVLVMRVVVLVVVPLVVTYRLVWRLLVSSPCARARTGLSVRAEWAVRRLAESCRGHPGRVRRRRTDAAVHG